MHVRWTLNYPMRPLGENVRIIVKRQNQRSKSHEIVDVVCLNFTYTTHIHTTFSISDAAE